MWRLRLWLRAGGLPCMCEVQDSGKLNKPTWAIIKFTNSLWNMSCWQGWDFQNEPFGASGCVKYLLPNSDNICMFYY